MPVFVVTLPMLVVFGGSFLLFFGGGYLGFRLGYRHGREVEARLHVALTKAL